MLFVDARACTPSRASTHTADRRRVRGSRNYRLHDLWFRA